MLSYFLAFIMLSYFADLDELFDSGTAPYLVFVGTLALAAPILVASGFYADAEGHIPRTSRSLTAMRGARLLSLHGLVIIVGAFGSSFVDPGILSGILLFVTLVTMLSLAVLVLVVGIRATREPPVRE